ncbi:MAG: class I SAM-dependent methyltransferase [Chloroflexi bacterium]|nr:class I SAM-dependent methyltransferase [Chloroflexota bacterium]
MKRDFIQLVQQGYDQVARDYLAWREEEPLLFRAELQDLAARLHPDAAVLDAGCGAGVPFTLWLSAKFSVTGIDLSAEQISLARQRVPRAIFQHQDMTALDLAPRVFDAITCFYSLIHVPRDQHARVLANFNRVLKPRGYLLVITGNNDLNEDVDNFFGAEMYWSHFDRATSLQTPALACGASVLRDAGFEIMWDRIVADRPSGSHVLALARKIKDPKGSR